MGCIDDKLIMFFATDGGKTGLFCIKFTEFDSVNFIQEKGFQLSESYHKNKLARNSQKQTYSK